MNDDPPRSTFRPIAFTLGGLFLIGGLIAMMVLGNKAPESGLGPWPRFLGPFHMLALHLPMGLMLLALVLELGWLFQRKPTKPGMLPLFLAAVSAVAAALLGFLLWKGNPGEYSGELFEQHLWSGMAFAILVVLACVVKAWTNHAGARGYWAYLLLLAAAGATMMVAGHAGGSMTHGRDFLTREAPEPLGKLLAQWGLSHAKPGTGKPQTQALPGTVDASQDADPVVYKALIQPIFDAKCVSCHGPDKQKGKLRMDRYELLLAGGKHSDILVPGDPGESEMIYRIELPLDDEDHMPPEEKKQLTEQEEKLLKWWIASGAKPEARLSELEPTAEIRTAVEEWRAASE